ncbi:ABC transporter permease subunit [Mycoplasmopsis phocirhinis]|uniref:ABC transporter permease subunit n=1 Tax=Mycoplasmopsis phocirhinis TaxID=142650 RepID=A0A4P6MS56_9BACT|nr:ABC transporter permease subunit [Mycoplasmopsis phocirhinis]QBF34909.1 ABC transporter permease subunit [Mycoplasmopsis phocirhinis]
MRINSSTQNTWVIKEKKWFRYRYKSSKNNQKTSWKLHPVFVHLTILFSIALLAYIIYDKSDKLRFENGNLIIQKIQNLFIFDTKSYRLTGRTSGEYTPLIFDSLTLLWLSIKLGLVGTFIGFLLALFTSILSFSRATNKYSAFAFKSIILVLRAMPELVFIRVITFTARNELSLLLVFVWFTWLWLHKYYIEIFENVDLSSYWNSINQGNNKFKAFYKEIWPRVKHRIYSLFIFSFESNMRWSSILGALSLPGIGVLISYGASQTTNFKELGIPLTFLMLFIVFLEIINIIFKKYLIEAKSKKIQINSNFKFLNYKKMAKHINVRKIIYFAIFSFCLILSIYTLSTIKWLFFELSATKSFFKYFFRPDFSVFNLKRWNLANPLYVLWESISFTILALALCIALTFIAIRLQSLSLNNRYLAFFWRIINVLVRLIPTIVYFFIFQPLFQSPLLLIIIIISLHEMSSISKQLSEAVDNLDEEIVSNMRIQGFSNNQIYFKYVLPTIKFDFIALSFFYFELIFRNSITYSIFAPSQLNIGTKIWTNLNTRNYHPEIAMAYTWLATFAILGINFVARIFTKQLKST